jgi:hypothetical protein
MSGSVALISVGLDGTVMVLDMDRIGEEGGTFISMCHCPRATSLKPKCFADISDFDMRHQKINVENFSKLRDRFRIHRHRWKPPLLLYPESHSRAFETRTLKKGPKNKFSPLSITTSIGYKRLSCCPESSGNF